MIHAYRIIWIANYGQVVKVTITKSGIEDPNVPAESLILLEDTDRWYDTPHNLRDNVWTIQHLPPAFWQDRVFRWVSTEPVNCAGVTEYNILLLAEDVEHGQ